MEALILGVIYFKYMCETKHMSSEFFTASASCFGDFAPRTSDLPKVLIELSVQGGTIEFVMKIWKR